MRKLLLFGALAFGLNAFGQGMYGDAKAQKIFENCIERKESRSNAEECNCHLELSDSLNVRLNKLYLEKEAILTNALKSELYLNDPMLFDAAIEQLKSLTILKTSFLMQRAALVNIDEQAGIGGNSCFSLVKSNQATAMHLDHVRRLDLLSEE